ncbi:MAG: hypothetical protein GVY29_06260 [Spirochaetes bacterium]|nr:hypothetical protein [Spirochaetota bacterium]
MSYVVDASVALRWFLSEERHPHANAILERITAEPGRFGVPELSGFEVPAVLTRVHPEPSVALHDGVFPVLAAELDAGWLTFDRKAHSLISETGLSVNLWDGMAADW